jgi:hypothetical protein
MTEVATYQPFTTLRLRDGMYCALPLTAWPFMEGYEGYTGDEFELREGQDEVEGLVELSDDPDIAERILALRLHADNFTDEVLDLGNNQFQLNPRIEKLGESPLQIVALVQDLKKALEGTLYADAMVVELMTAGWAQVVRATSDPNNQVLGNTAYYLITLGREDYVDAWNGHMPPDRRKTKRVDDGTWLVVTDDEADDALNAALDHYIDNEADIPDWLHHYIDREKLKDDLWRDGRAPRLARDGIEHTVMVNDCCHYLYRQA